MAEEKKDLLGDTGERVRSNVERLRLARGMSKKDVADRTHELGRPIPPLGVSRIEAGTRRVDADDLIALALVFNVSPLTLLMPSESNNELINLTRNYPVTSRTAWDWAEGQKTAMDYEFGDGVNLAGPDVDPAIQTETYEREQEFERSQEAYAALARPPERRRISDHPALRLIRNLADLVADLIAPSPDVDEAGHAARERMAGRRYQQLGIELDDLAERELWELKRQHPGLISHVRVRRDGTVRDVSKPRQE